MRERIDAYLGEVDTLSLKSWNIKPSDYPAGKALLAGEPADQVRAILESFKSGRRLDRSQWLQSRAILVLRNQLLRRKLPFTAEQIDQLAAEFRTQRLTGSGSQILTVLERYFGEHGELPPTTVAALKTARSERITMSEIQKLAARIDALLGIKETLPLHPGEAWSDVAISDIEGMPTDAKNAWMALLTHCQSASSGKPAKKWLNEGRKILDRVGEKSFVMHLVRWLPLVDKPRTQPLDQHYHVWWPDTSLVIIEPHADILKGLTWCCSLIESRELARALAGLAVSGYRKIPQVGPRLIKVGNAAVWALGNMPGRDAIGHLAYLKVKITFGTARKQIEMALTAAAEREGLPRDEIEEMSVPAYGLTEVGLLEQALGEFTARLAVIKVGKSELTWLKPDGKPQKSVPAAVKADFGDELKELKASGKDIDKMLVAQRDRIDTLFLERKSWPLATWRERYLDHPLVGVVARKLIWRFTTGKTIADGIWHDGKLVDHFGHEIKGLGDKTAVSPWHPTGEPLESVLQWRNFIEEHEIRQPFKQAHREVYLLTDAERNTRTYSNRFAAHLLKQHQFNALCGVRGWKNRLRLMVDDDYEAPHKLLPEWGLRAEFWVEGAGGEYGTDTTESGSFLHLATDQVRFYKIDAAQNYAHASGGGYRAGWRQMSAEPVPLEEIPPLALSEVMRDIDLFVGVASVGNDPQWVDGGREGRYRDYWSHYSFGDLSATAQTRKDVLEKLIPRLKIADRCSFSDRFLVVRGDWRTYKIHLGSGNILMEPNDEYLCIVPKASMESGDSLYLPFEGDRTLSIVISKALLLADDTKITDPTITRQIRGAVGVG